MGESPNTENSLELDPRKFRIDGPIGLAIQVGVSSSIKIKLKICYTLLLARQLRSLKRRIAQTARTWSAAA